MVTYAFITDYFALKHKSHDNIKVLNDHEFLLHGNLKKIFLDNYLEIM